MQEILKRAQLLFSQNRPDLAEPECRRLLSVDPDNPAGHALLALCLLRRKAYADALHESAEATRLDPGDPHHLYVRAAVLMDVNRDPDALTTIRRAITLQPFHPDFHALLSALHLKNGRWTDALAAADQGLEFDPEHVDCHNYRSQALVKLGRREEASRAMADTLSLSPENAFSHANQGWTLLHQRQPKEAMVHFKEALRLDPTMDWARAGIVEALKAHNFVYRWMLAYFLFMARLSKQAQWGIIVGGWFGAQLLRRTADQNPSLSPYITPAIIAYGVFVILTWLAYPFFNLLLRLSRYGRLALSPQQTLAANAIGATLLATLVLFALAIYTNAGILASLTIMLGLFTLPLAALFSLPVGRPRLLYGLALLSLPAIAAFDVYRFLQLGPAQWDPNDRLTTYLYTVLLLTLLANAFAQVRVRKA